MDRGNGARPPRIAIIPAYNEEPVIGRMLDSIPPGLFDEVIVAVNGATDGTAQAARRHGATVVEIPERGYGAACLAALSFLAGRDGTVMFLQADASEPLDEADGLLRIVETGQADLALGSRALGRAAEGALLPHQRFGNWLAVTLIRWRYGHRYTDLGPMRALSLATWRKLGMRERTYGWTVEMQVRALQCGLRVVELPVRSGLRLAGENKVSGNLRASVLAGWRILATIARLSGPRRPRAAEHEA
jgi:glycosyltransferase involved in cell wall biosynthesis